MKIDATSSVYSIERYKAQATSKVAEKQSQIAASDQVELSTDALSFAETFAAVKSTLTVQLNGPSPMIESVRTQIASGTYTVDPEEVASSILLFT